MTLAEEDASRFPGKDDRSTYLKACLRSRVGELGEALQVLNEATRRGLWWSEEALKTETDLDPVRERPEFNIFLAECGRMKHIADRTAKPELTVLTPTGYSPGEVRPVMIAFHARGDDFVAFVGPWRHAPS